MPDGATRIARLDLNPGAPHVQEQGPHLNLEEQGGSSGYRDPHTPVDSSTARPGDIPC
jgi:hypothetical protein